MEGLEGGGVNGYIQITIGNSNKRKGSWIEENQSENMNKQYQSGIELR